MSIFLTRTRFPPFFFALFSLVVDVSDSDEYRSACDNGMKATLAVEDVWNSDRFSAFMLHCMILRELHFRATNQDIKMLKKKFLRNDAEPGHVRTQAAFTLGVLETNRGEMEEAADMYREGVEAGRACSATERSKMIRSDVMGSVSVGSLVDENMRSLRSNLSVLEGRGVTYNPPADVQRRADGTPVPAMGPSISVSATRNSGLSADQLAELVERAMTVGGNKCDNCNKTLEELGKTKFECCSRCKLVYYCSRECQTEHWKVRGHKQACRAFKNTDIRPGDYMRLHNLASKPEMNGRIVKAVQKAPSSSGAGEGGGSSNVTSITSKQRWVVEDTAGEKRFSISVENLAHIRPA